MARNNEDKTRLLALANLKLGKSPRETSETVGISYASAVSLRKELAEAELRNTVLDLFNMEQAAFEALLDAARAQLEPAVEGELITQKEVDQSIETVANQVKGLGILEEEFQKTAVNVVRQINLMVITTNSADTVLALAEALAKLQTAFFAKGTNVQVNNFGQNGKRFEALLGE